MEEGRVGDLAGEAGADGDGAVGDGVDVEGPAGEPAGVPELDGAVEGAEADEAAVGGEARLAELGVLLCGALEARQDATAAAVEEIDFVAGLALEARGRGGEGNDLRRVGDGAEGVVLAAAVRDGAASILRRDLSS